MPIDASINPPIKSGFCFGGPANTLRVKTNGELGFIWVDVNTNTVWIYNWEPVRQVFFVLDPEGQPIVYDDNPDDGIRYGVENESQYGLLLRPSNPPQG